MQLAVGANIPLFFQAWDGDSGLYARAFLYNPDFTPYSVPYVDLTLKNSSGLYGNESLVMPNQPIVAIFAFYSDSGYTQLDYDHTIAEETYTVTGSGGGSTLTIMPNNVNLKGEIKRPLPVSGVVKVEQEQFAKANISALTLVGVISIQQDIKSYIQEGALQAKVSTQFLTGQTC